MDINKICYFVLSFIVVAPIALVADDVTVAAADVVATAATIAATIVVDGDDG